MNIPVKEKVISELQEHIGVRLYQLPRKQIFYYGKLANGIEILVCTPQSKLHINGHGWIDLTIIQVSMLDEAGYSILAFRLEGDKVYYLNFCDLKPYLTEEALFNNEREGDHWKLYIWPKYIQILRNGRRLQIKPNNFEELEAPS